MSFFNDLLKKAMETGEYICDECGGPMEFENEWRDTLVCPKCGNSMDIDHYGLTDEEYEDLYPTEEEVLGIAGEDDEIDEDNPYGETYDEVCGELSDD